MSRESAPSAKQGIWTPANIVTVVRICLVPVFILALLSPWPMWFGIDGLVDDQAKSLIAVLLFAIISCTDWVDGYLARSRDEVTDFGKFMDPLADKILVAAALLALIELQVLPSWPVLIILTREFIVSGIRMLAASKGVVIAASWYGKAKTVFQIAAIILFLLKGSLHPADVTSVLHDPLYLASWAVMLIALALTIVSLVDYLAKAWPLIKQADVSGREDAIKGEALPEPIQKLAGAVIAHAVENGLTLCTAESLTGGMISTALTSVSGSSQAFLGGIVSYALSVKEKTLDVDGRLLEREGAVDGNVAMQMAQGAAKETGADVAVSVTGIAGPGGAEPGKPVGTVFIGFHAQSETGFEEAHFTGAREEIRQKTTARALEVLDALMVRA